MRTDLLAVPGTCRPVGNLVGMYEHEEKRTPRRLGEVAGVGLDLARDLETRSWAGPIGESRGGMSEVSRSG